ncbi:uncharacterized protein PHACADRAFT_248617 [Phanerochaete carnosa HHB-10118-sp]|uniref:F-box domain-containing protein n=1 Tax=Phanerochaete carnosa (strain HHB-10118-sp) TaxID=650164 RepID=K5WCT1_PHACS|nr:uncharacterized protein PHACADRAFT_248617 [Phanerochaete carnosa HHB-10118-sp]EKM61773.1 hypothetical protein PHACADRAFT_248617 [Phanerochaete carnosa HHB-10118-sp]
MVYPFQNLVAWLTRDFGQHRCPLIIHPQGLDAAARSPELSKLSSFSPSDQYGLPLELWELIIDSLCDDVNALLACAATCSVFLRRSRHHLYKRVMLRTEDDANLFVQTLANDKANWDAVRELKLAGQLLCERDRNTTPLLFPMLRRLYTLVVYRLEQDALAHIHLFLAPVQQSITKFSLCAAHLPSFSSLSNLLLSFPHLRDLSLLGITFMQDVDVSTIKVYKPQLHLTLLDLSVPFGHGNYSYIQAMASWVCHVSFTTLCCLRLQLPLGAEMASAAEQLVHANRATLHTLALDFGCSHWENGELLSAASIRAESIPRLVPSFAAAL